MIFWYLVVKSKKNCINIKRLARHAQQICCGQAKYRVLPPGEFNGMIS